MITAYIDTGPLYEFVAAEKKDFHQRAKELLLSQNYQWFSSTYIFDELMTLFLGRISKKKIISVGENLKNSSIINWVHPDPDDDEACWDIFKKYSDKLWSYTDCMSLHLIQKNKIKKVFSFDHHFEQMGLDLL